MCIDEQLLSAYLDGELSEPYKTQTEEHLEHCQACRNRLEKMTKLSEMLAGATLSDEELNGRMETSLNIIERKYFDGNGKKVSFFRRRIEMSLSGMVTAAAAVVVVFMGGAMMLGGDSGESSEIVPSFSSRASSENVHFVSQKRESLDNYSLDEIMKYLDSKGYEVRISIKGLSPIDENVAE